MTGILPIAAPEPEVARPIPVVALSGVTQRALIAGVSCKKVGQIRSTSAGKFKCAAVGKRRIWQRLATTAIETTTSVTTSTTTIPPLSTDAVVASTQSLTEGVDLSSSRNTTSVVMHVEPGPNGEWPTLMEGALKFSLDFFSALGFTFTQPKIDFVLGRTQSWSKTKFGELFPRCWPDASSFDGGYSMCAYPDRGGIAINLVYSVLSKSASTDANVAGVKRDVLWNSVPHEAWHNWQDGIGYTNGVRDEPTWWKEGGAVYFSTIAWAKFLDKSRSLDTLWFWEVEPNGYQHLSAAACTMKIANLSNSCSYSKGALVVQHFIYRFGVDKYRALYTTWQRNKTFSENFQQVTGLTLDKFYELSEEWLSSRGWQSK